MGWCKATFVCHDVLKALALRVEGIDHQNYFCDGDVARARTSSLIWSAYVDNFFCIGPNRAQVEAVTRGVDAELRKAGLPTHEQAWAASEADLIGWHLDGRQKQVKPTARRAKRCQLAIVRLCESHRVCPKDVERVVGHCSFLALLRREFLSIFRSVYAFINRFPHSPLLVPFGPRSVENSTRLANSFHF